MLLHLPAWMMKWIIILAIWREDVVKAVFFYLLNIHQQVRPKSVTPCHPSPSKDYSFGTQCQGKISPLSWDCHLTITPEPEPVSEPDLTMDVDTDIDMSIIMKRDTDMDMVMDTSTDKGTRRARARAHDKGAGMGANTGMCTISSTEHGHEHEHEHKHKHKRKRACTLYKLFEHVHTYSFPYFITSPCTWTWTQVKSWTESNRFTLICTIFGLNQNVPSVYKKFGLIQNVLLW
jgi:hypothetical protein